MSEQITITLMDDGSILVDNDEAAVAWQQKTGKHLVIAIGDSPSKGSIEFWKKFDAGLVTPPVTDKAFLSRIYDSKPPANVTPTELGDAAN